MDQDLKLFLDSHDEKYWTDITKRLTYEALRMLSRYGFGGGNLAERAGEYAVDAVSEVFVRCMNGATSRFRHSRGNAATEVEERFWSYLVLNCLRPLITRDAEKWVSRSRWPIVPLEEAFGVPEEVPEENEDLAKAIVDQFIDQADNELKPLLLAAREQFQQDPDRKDINWKAIQRSLGISRYACDNLRKRLDALRLKLLQDRITTISAP